MPQNCLTANKKTKKIKGNLEFIVQIRDSCKPVIPLDTKLSALEEQQRAGSNQSCVGCQYRRLTSKSTVAFLAVIRLRETQQALQFLRSCQRY